MRLPLVGAALLALWFALCASASASSFSAIEAASYMLYENGKPACSSQVVRSADGETHILTAAHCVTNTGADFSIRRLVRDGPVLVSYTDYMADILRKNEATDVALIVLRDKSVTFDAVDVATVEEADKALFKGARVIAVGYPNTRGAPMSDLVFTEGLFTGRRYVGKREVFRTTADAWFGSSGGGLYAMIDGEWKLVATCSGGDTDTPWLTTYWATVDAVNAIIADN